MSISPVDILAQRLALAASRRASLLAIGVPGLAAIAGIPPAAGGKKKRQKDKNKTCKRQVGQCNGYFALLCAEERAPEDCAEQIGVCCAFLGNCQAEAFIDCLLAILRPTRPEIP